MTPEEIIDMARQAGFFVWTDEQKTIEGYGEDLERFAKLVDAKATAREREACAKVCESHGPTLANGVMLAEAIRARGEA